MDSKRKASLFLLIALIAVSIRLIPFSNGDTILTKGDFSFYEDDFSSDTGLWDFNGVAYRDTGESYIVLTNAMQSTWGHIWLKSPVEGPFTVSFRYKAGGGTGADGLALLFYQTTEVEGHLPLNVAGSMLSGAYDTSGYGVEFDNYQNGFDPSSNHIALRDYHNSHLAVYSDSRTEDNAWHQVIVNVGFENIIVTIDANVVINWVGVIHRTNTTFGFGAACGADTNWHFIDDFSLWVLNTEVSTVSDWPFFHQNVRHTGISVSDGPTSNELLWTYQTGADVRSSPAVLEGRLYVGSLDNYFYCLNADTGDLLWRFRVERNGIDSSPAVVYSRVFFGSYDGYVYCVDAESGGLYWKYHTGGGVRSAPIIVENNLYIGSEDGSLYCLNAFTGTKIWSKTVAGSYFYYTSPAFYEGKIFVIGTQVFCLDAYNGEMIWSEPTYSDSNASPVIKDGYVYIGYSRPGWGRLDCFNIDDGELIWTFTPGAAICSTPAVADGKIFFGSCDDRMYALNAYNGDLIWSFHANSYEIRSSPAYANGLLYFGDHNLDHISGSFYCLNATNGTLLWKYVTGHEQIWSSPAVVDGRAYVGASNGIIYCFGVTRPHYYIVIDRAEIVDTRVDVDSIQTIKLHARWNNGSNARECVITLNGDNYTTDANGWTGLSYAQSTIGMKKWVIAGVNCNNISNYVQTIDDPHVIWDKVEISLNIKDNRIDAGTEVKIDWFGSYAYDSEEFLGDVEINCSLSNENVGKYTYSVSSITDSLYNLTRFDSNNVICIWDRIKIADGSVSSNQTLVGNMETIQFKAVYEYDSEPFTNQNGVLYMNNEPMTWSSHDEIWKYSTTREELGAMIFEITSVNDTTYGISVINDEIGSLSIEWKPRGIPGFPYESIYLGLLSAILMVLWKKSK